MLKKLAHAKEEWGGTLSVIDKWLDARQNVIVLYCELAGLPPYKREKRCLPAQEQITTFCQKLLDYASRGHFDIYEQIILQCKLDDQKNLQLAQELYSHITSTTETALNFNDKYAESASEEDLLDFDKDLSELGEVMENRFGREDQLLSVVHLHHTLA